MKAINRRDLCVSLPAYMVLSGRPTKAQPVPLPKASVEQILSQSEVFSLDRMPVREMPNGGKSWNILHGELATGEIIALHESTQPAGLAPNPPHTIQHSELIFVREGTLLFEHDGKSQRVDAGGIILVAFGTRHTARNIGDGPANYLVIAIGGDTR